MSTSSPSLDAAASGAQIEARNRMLPRVWRSLNMALRKAPRPHILAEAEFQRQFLLERKRVERSGRSFVLVRIAAPALFGNGSGPLKPLLRTLTSATRHTDIVGWQETGKVLGIICTELGGHEENSAGRAIVKKYEMLARKKLAGTPSNRLDLSFAPYRLTTEAGQHMRQRQAAGR